MKNVRQANVNIHRDAWVEINLGNLEHNILELRKNLAPNMKMLGVVKADAYGHGAVMLAPTMLASGIDMLGVASIDEGLDLREAKINCEILVVGAVPLWAFESAIKNNISISIFSEDHINACKQAYARTGIRPKVHVKLDTGMNRIGLPCRNEVSCKKAINYIKRLQSCDFLELKGVFTHLANAENPDLSDYQFKMWENVVSEIDTDGLFLHILNTAGSISYKESSNMVREGIALYGLYPDLPEKVLFMPKLKPVMSLKARITNIHEIEEDEGVSYGYTFKAFEPAKVATIPLGYADGVPRALSNKIFGYLNGQKVRQIGNITMDQMMFDISGIDAKEGDIITLLNEKDLTIDDWAKLIGTINYELTCRLKVRLPRVYTR